VKTDRVPSGPARKKFPHSLTSCSLAGERGPPLGKKKRERKTCPGGGMGGVVIKKKAKKKKTGGPKKGW